MGSNLSVIPSAAGRMSVCEGMWGSKPHATQAHLKAREEMSKCAATSTRGAKTAGSPRLRRPCIPAPSHPPRTPPAPAAHGHDGDYIEHRDVPVHQAGNRCHIEQSYHA